MLLFLLWKFVSIYEIFFQLLWVTFWHSLPGKCIWCNHLGGNSSFPWLTCPQFDEHEDFCWHRFHSFSVAIAHVLFHESIHLSFSYYSFVLQSITATVLCGFCFNSCIIIKGYCVMMLQFRTFLVNPMLRGHVKYDMQAWVTDIMFHYFTMT